LSRPLSENEAHDAMSMILAGQAEPEQVGALLVVMRYRKETPEELAGFVRAARDHLSGFDRLEADVDWPSYADRHKQLPYFVPAARLLAQAGLKVAMHGLAGEGAATTGAVVEALGMRRARSAEQASDALARDGFAYLEIEAVCPPLARLFDLRPKLGVRTAVNSFARALNPVRAPVQLVGVFHPTYCETHRQTARLLGQRQSAIFKGGGGEAQRNPEKPCRVTLLEDGVASEEVWPALSPDTRHPWRDEPLDPDRVAALWRGAWHAPGPEAAVIGTAAIGLKLAGRAASREQAETLAARLWQERQR
jgi:anthranilate phosphoribosyltransferase